MITQHLRKSQGLAVQHCPSYKEIDPNQWIRFEITESGYVKNVFLKDKAARESRIGACILKTIRKWRFDGFENGGKNASLSMPIYFKTCLPINGECIFSPPSRI